MPGNTSISDSETLLPLVVTLLVLATGRPSVTLKNASRPAPNVGTNERPVESKRAASNASCARPWLEVSKFNDEYSKLSRLASTGISISENNDVIKEEPSSNFGEHADGVTLV